MNNAWLEHIYKQLHREGYLWAKQCCYYDDGYAEEVMQLVYLKLLEGKAKFNKQAALKTWFFSVIRYTAIDYVKKQQPQIPMEVLRDSYYAVNEEEEIKSDYTEILSQLPERQHQVLLLYFYHNLTLKEIAEILEIGIGSVRTHYDRGKKKLKSILINQQEQWQRMIN